MENFMQDHMRRMQETINHINSQTDDMEFTVGDDGTIQLTIGEEFIGYIGFNQETDESVFSTVGDWSWNTSDLLVVAQLLAMHTTIFREVNTHVEALAELFHDQYSSTRTITNFIDLHTRLASITGIGEDPIPDPANDPADNDTEDEG
jgi:hypothetical protein